LKYSKFVLKVLLEYLMVHAFFDVRWIVIGC